MQIKLNRKNNTKNIYFLTSILIFNINYSFKLINTKILIMVDQYQIIFQLFIRLFDLKDSEMANKKLIDC